MFNGEEWIVLFVGLVDFLNGFIVFIIILLNLILVCDELGIISGLIDGNVELLGGWLVLDYVLVENIFLFFKFVKGVYIGDGILSK